MCSSYIGIYRNTFVTCNVFLLLEMQAPTVEVQAVLEVLSDVDEGTLSSGN